MLKVILLKDVEIATELQHDCFLDSHVNWTSSQDFDSLKKRKIAFANIVIKDNGSVLTICTYSCSLALNQQ